MKKLIRQIWSKGEPPRELLLVERSDGTYSFLEDEPSALKAYRPKRGERLARLRAFVRLP